MSLPQEIEVLLPTLASLPMAVMTTDCDGVARWANASFTTLTGYSVDEIVGQDAMTLEPGDSTHPLHDRLHHVVASGEPWKGESVGKRKNGELYHSHRTITPIRDGSNVVTHALWTLEDRTEQELAEEGLEQLQKVVSAPPN